MLIFRRIGWRRQSVCRPTPSWQSTSCPSRHSLSTRRPSRLIGQTSGVSGRCVRRSRRLYFSLSRKNTSSLGLHLCSLPKVKKKPFVFYEVLCIPLHTHFQWFYFHKSVYTIPRWKHIDRMILCHQWEKSMSLSIVQRSSHTLTKCVDQTSNSMKRKS